MLTFKEAEQLILRGRGGKKKLENNTYLERESEDEFGVVLHSTTIVRIFRDGSYILDSGGWHTVTTKDRMNRYAMNRYAPHGVSQCKYVWYVKGKRFYDGIKILPNGEVELKCRNCGKRVEEEGVCRRSSCTK